MLVNEVATTALQGLPRVSLRSLGDNGGEGTRLLLPADCSIEYLSNHTVRTEGLGPDLDRRTRELLSLVAVEDAAAAKFSDINVVSPRTYADSLVLPFVHVVAQTLIYFRWSRSALTVVRDLIDTYPYGARPGDRIWLSAERPETLSTGTVCLVMNRRVGGWDGTRARPVVELLGGGGHVATRWHSASGSFRMQTINETIRRELREELSLGVKSAEFRVVGGFVNTSTNELVVLCLHELDVEALPGIQSSSKEHFSEDVDGTYLGPFNEVMRDYLKDASDFAGGNGARATNFPSNAPLMARIRREVAG